MIDNAQEQMGVHPESTLLDREDDKWLRYLTPLEHVLLLSTIDLPDGTSLNAEQMLEKDVGFLTTPLGIGLGLTIDTIGRERENKYIQGVLGIIEADSELIMAGYEQRLHLPRIREGKIDPYFRVQVVRFSMDTRKYSLVSDPEIAGRFKIASEFSDRFTIQPLVENPAELTISLRT